MAGDWVQMRCELEDDPTVVYAAQSLSRSAVTGVTLAADVLWIRLVIGCLHKLWSVADAHTVDGVLSGYTVETMDAKVGLPGFCRALADAPKAWLEISGNTLRLPSFGEYMGASAKRRAADRRRQQRHRDGHVAVTTKRDTTVTREEKRRGEERREEMDGTGRDDHARASLNWEEVRDFCRRTFSAALGGRLSAEDRELCLKLGALRFQGTLPEAWLVGALEAIRQHDGPVRNRAAYLQTCLQATAHEHGQNLGQLLARIELPQELLIAR